MTKLAASKIAVIESELGWGRKIDDYMVCLTQEDSLKFKKEFNSENTDETTPDWYMVCEGDPIPVDLSENQYSELEKEGRVWLNTLNSI